MIGGERARSILAAVFAAPIDGAASPAERLCAVCTDLLPGSVGAGLWMWAAGQLEVVATSGAPVAALEDAQYSLGEGPCLDARRTRRPVIQPDLSSAKGPQWPLFAPLALQSGARAAFAFPLQVGGIELGVLSLYREMPGWLTAEQTAVALAAADAAVLLMLHLQDGSGAGVPADEPDVGWTTRAEIHQASGMIAVQAGVDVKTALLLLRARSYAAGLPIVALATDVLERRERFDPLPPVDE